MGKIQPIQAHLEAVRSRLSSASALPRQPGLNGKNGESARRETSSTSPSRMQQVWARMSEIYGHKWLSSYGPEPSQAWCAALADISVEQLAAGFRWCVTGRSDPWPPSLPEFRHACLQAASAIPEARAYGLGMAYASAVQYGRFIPETPPEVVETCRRATSLALISTSAEKSQKLFGYHYAQVLADMARGVQFAGQTPVRAIERDLSSTPAEVQEWAEKLRAALRGA